MVDKPILLSALWIALMLTYLLGDVLRVFIAVILLAGKMGNVQFTQGMWLGIRGLDADPDRDGCAVSDTASTGQSLGQHHCCQLLFLFNLVGLPTYPSAYDKFLIVAGLVFNVLTVWYAWNWS